MVGLSLSACKTEAEKREELRYQWQQEYNKISEQNLNNKWDCKYAYSARHGNPGKPPKKPIWDLEKDPEFKKCIEEARKWFDEQRKRMGNIPPK